MSATKRNKIEPPQNNYDIKLVKSCKISSLEDRTDVNWPMSLFPAKTTLPSWFLDGEKKKTMSANRKEVEDTVLKNKDTNQLKGIALSFKHANHVLGGEARMFSTLVNNSNGGYSTICRHTHYNTFHEQFEYLTKRLRQLQRMAEGENNVLHRMIFTFSEKLETVEGMHTEIDEMINKEPLESITKLNSWLQRHLTCSYSKCMQQLNHLPEYKHQLALVVEEIDRIKHLPMVKPIQILECNFQIEMYEKQIPTIIKEKRNRKKDEGRNNIIAKNTAFDEHIIVADCLKKFCKLKSKLKDVDVKLKNKMNRFATSMKNIEVLENLKIKQNQTSGGRKLGFCDMMEAKDQLARNKETIRCLKKKLEKINNKNP